uniref:Lipid phosphate phosphohydrolase 3-like n=1 Tax=Saccoglossus kowalevskii TaxID=10224 RepID=A0ABM0MRU0_SACKO
IILNESFLYVLSRKRQEKNSYNKCHYIKTKKVNPLLYYLYYIIGVFLFGSATTQLATACIKKLIGRLRPHFLTVCIPNYDLFNCSDGYIEADVCTGDPHIISEARLSFLSGHSSLAWFSALYLAVRFVWNLPKLVKPTLQFTSLMLGLLCSLTRISDYYHHPTDVLWGSLLGIVIALLTYVYISGLLKMHMAIPGRHRYAETEQSKQEHIDIPKTETEDVIETGLPC